MNINLEEEDLEIEKRRRAPNFSRKELKLLNELVKVYNDQINNKSNTSVSIAVKNKAWKELAKDFNASMGSDIYRSADTLRRRYDNSKKKWNHQARVRSSGSRVSKKEDNEESYYDSNDGQFSGDDEDNAFEEGSYVNTSMKMEEDNADDDEPDNLDIKELIRVHITSEKEDNDHADNIEIDTGSEQKSFNHNSPKRDSAHNLTNGQRSSTSNIEMHPSLVSQQKQCFMQEHRMRLRHMQERHELELELIRLEHKEKLKIMREEHQRRIHLLELEKSEGPHSILADDEFYDAIESGLDKMEEEQELRERLINGQMIPITPPPVSPAEQHILWPTIDQVVKQQVTMAKMGIGECGTGWQLFAEDGEMKMYRREEEIDGFVCDPLKAVHVVKGITGHEVCHYFFHPNYRYDWETTLEHMTVLETIADDTLIFHQVHKRIWPASQRDVIFWSHMRNLSNDQDRDGPDMWTVVNNSTDISSHPANVGKCVRIYLTVCLLCQTKVTPPKDGTSVTRDNVSCKITYCSKVNPGGWAPASVLRAVYKREYPKFLKRFTAYVKNQTKNKPLMF